MRRNKTIGEADTLRLGSFGILDTDNDLVVVYLHRMFYSKCSDTFYPLPDETFASLSASVWTAFVHRNNMYMFMQIYARNSKIVQLSSRNTVIIHLQGYIFE